MNLYTRRDALSRIGLLTGAAATAAFAGCAKNPVTGKREFMLMSEKEEIAMGRQAHEEIKSQYGVYDSQQIQDWFNERGQEMAKISHRPGLPWTFTMMDSPVVNAFAVPGGFVYETRGILAYFNDEAQMAGVLGHEIGHVNARHTAINYSRAQVAQYGLAIGSIFSEEFARWSDLASLGTSLLFLKFSRDDERQADELGVLYSSTVGYDATHMSMFFTTLARLGGGHQSLPEWESTHPDPGDRVNTTLKLARAFQQKHPDKTYVVRRAEYLDLIDGMVFGENPRQGYVKDGTFYHPELSFQFPVPADWQVTNSPAEVRLAPKDGSSLIIFTVSSGATPQEAAQQFARNNKVGVASSAAINVNGMPGYRTVGELTSGQQTLAIVSSYIGKDNKIFTFHGITDPGRITSATGVFDSVVMYFNHIANKSYLEVEPRRVTIRTVDRRVALRREFNAIGVPESKLESLATLNGLELNQDIEPGYRLKIISGEPAGAEESL